jgi:UDP-glucose:(heptosyl)LPS alpha-1,3-glucosyltransferase
VGRVQAAVMPTDPDGRHRAWGTGLTGRVELALERRVFKQSGCTALPATEALLRQLQTYYPRAAEGAMVLPNGVDLEVFSRRQAPARRSSIREALGIAETRQVAVFVGGEFEQRGLDLAVDLLEPLKDLSLLVLGGRVEDLKPFRDRARAAATADRLYHIRHTDQPAAFLAAADVFLLPRAGDGFPLAVLEAIATGLPVLVAASPATRELLDDSGAGLLLEPELKAFEEALGRLLREPAERLKMGQAAAELSKQYDWDRLVERFEQAFQSLSDKGE